MIKRVVKLSSLLVVATSILSIVPVMAADVKKVSAEDGTIYGAKVTGSGKFIDASLNDEAEAIYYIKDGKFTKLENAEGGDAIDDVYEYEGVSYLRLANGEYCINLNTGERVNRDIKQEKLDDNAMALRRKIKKDNDGRFAESNFTGQPPANKGNTGMGEYFRYKLEKPKANGDDQCSIYTNDKGNYIDGDFNLGRVGIVTTGASVYINGNNITFESKNITMKNTKDTYEIKDTSGKIYEVKAAVSTPNDYYGGSDALVENFTKNIIFRTAMLSIWIKEKDADDNTYVNITDGVEFGSSVNHHKVPIRGTGEDKYTPVIQKISKDQSSDDVDGIKYSKEVFTYFETDSDGKEYTSDELLSILSCVTVFNGAVTANGYGSDGKFLGQTLKLKSRGGYYYVEAGDIDSIKLADFTSIDWGGWDGFTYLTKGYVQRFNPTTEKFEKILKVDGSMTHVSAAMSDNVVVWNDNGAYSITNPATTTDTSATGTGATTTTDAAVKIGWVKNADGTWSNIKADGTKATGWLKDGAIWYYFNALGVMQTGWINDNGTWYYCSTSGEMLANTTVDGYLLDNTGAWIK